MKEANTKQVDALQATGIENHDGQTPTNEAIVYDFINERPTLEKRSERYEFVCLVHFLVFIAWIVTLGAVVGLLSLFTDLVQLHYADVVGSVFYSALALSLFFYVGSSLIASSLSMDVTHNKLFVWLVQLAWLVIFCVMWLRDASHQLIMLWTVVDLTFVLLETMVDTQMVYGGGAESYHVSQWIIAPLNLYWDLMLLFVINAPLMAVVINSGLDLFLTR